MTSLRNYLHWYFHKGWTKWDVIWTMFQITLTILIVNQPTTWLISTVIMVVSLAGLMYSFGRRHQSDIDFKQTKETLEVAQETRKLLNECYMFETWYFSMGQDPKVPTRIMIHSRVCPN